MAAPFSPKLAKATTWSVAGYVVLVNNDIASSPLASPLVGQQSAEDNILFCFSLWRAVAASTTTRRRLHSEVIVMGQADIMRPLQPRGRCGGAIWLPFIITRSL